MSSDLIQVGRVAGAFGVRGEVRITSFTADPVALVDYKDLKREDGSPGLTLTSGRAAKGSIIVRAKEVETRDQAEALRGLKLYIARDSLPAPEEDEFYVTDLVGLKVETAEGEALGVVKTVQDFGAGDLLEIIPPEGGATWYLPFTRAAVPEVRLAAGVVVAVKPDEVE
ncbi:MAG: ribosome maturation factor RimM [Alphaproteobacteria bacterium]|nr:ribosome maturation factor RimM [Alphaproteobacteria bacterium]MBU1514892.1 ribosome maturation factor RimM [Alphaproteobacteria bacterium]MBU2093813.1 ribosome maturation factor RimM [Alphaproteobacteria bacterium]MBU2149434.1 ribosome maturation factor RimM [Alphaproteobacteria bacterium]MBU2305394.1 ribosome maturation factor RimM [Alphaproteobacteria bacterium]